MQKENLNEKTEKKTVKEWISENKGKIVIGGTCVLVGVGSYLTYKYRVKLIAHDAMIKQNADNIEFVRDIVKEGALEEAIATVNRKINYRLDKIEHLKQRFQENGPELISKYEEELKELMVKQESFVAEYNSIKIK